MIVEFGQWRLAPYQTNGARCWQVMRGKQQRGIRFYDNLGDALRFTAEYDLRNECEGVGGIADALQAYERLTERIENAAVRVAGSYERRANREND